MAPAPDALPLVAGRRERHAAALLQAAVDLELHEEGRGDADEAAVERPPAEDVGDVLPAEAKAEQAVRDVAALDVAVDQIDRVLLQAGDEAHAARGRPVARLAAGLRAREPRVDAEIGVEAHHEDRAVVGLSRAITTLEVVEPERHRLREAAALDDHVAPRIADLVALERRVRLELDLGRARPQRQQRRDPEGGGRRAPPLGAAE
ncbi:MAG: hypothetical protein QM820_41560 [Minicystis sp.]